MEKERNKKNLQEKKRFRTYANTLQKKYTKKKKL